uniref:Uncharacterized protein n=1 Tax=Rhipicephalus zambeziensis TaxID=60191 RepID=A0A224Y5U0_9ACAR
MCCVMTNRPPATHCSKKRRGRNFCVSTPLTLVGNFVSISCTLIGISHEASSIGFSCQKLNAVSGGIRFIQINAGLQNCLRGDASRKTQVFSKVSYFFFICLHKFSFSSFTTKKLN